MTGGCQRARRRAAGGPGAAPRRRSPSSPRTSGPSPRPSCRWPSPISPAAPSPSATRAPRAWAGPPSRPPRRPMPTPRTAPSGERTTDRRTWGRPYTTSPRAADATEVLMRLGSPVWVEDKYDGIRAQLHRRDGEARLYSRDLHDVSGQFPEVVAAAVQLSWDGLLDGELLAWKGGTALPFQQLPARPGRQKPPGAPIAGGPRPFRA